MNNYSYTSRINPVGSSSPYPHTCGTLYLIHNPEELEYLPVYDVNLIVGGICPDTQQIFLKQYVNGKFVTTSYSLVPSESQNARPENNIEEILQRFNERLTEIEKTLNNKKGGRYNELL